MNAVCARARACVVLAGGGGGVRARVCGNKNKISKKKWERQVGEMGKTCKEK